MIKKLTGLAILSIITGIMVVLMLVTIYRTDDMTDEPGLLFPDLYNELTTVDTIRFSSGEGQFILKRDGEDWFLPEHYNYPADFDRVKRMLVDMADAKLLEPKTDKEAQYSILGVEGAEPDVAGGSSITIELSDGDEPVAGVILGKVRDITVQTGPQQVYVRRVGDKQSWLVEGYLQISPAMLNWIQLQVMDLARERIAKVEIVQPDGSKAELVNLGEKDKFGTPEAGKDTVFKYEQLGYDIAGSLHQLRMEDVLPVAEFKRGNAEVVTARFTTFDGLVVTSQTSFNDGFYFSTFSADYDASAVQQAPEDIQQLDVLKTAEEVQSEAAELNEKLSPWVYRLSGFVGTNLMRAKEDMVEQPEPEADAMPTEAESSPLTPMAAPDFSGFGPAQ